MSKNNDRIVYSLNVIDIQAVAVEEFGRALTEVEMEIVEREIGDYIAWRDAIEFTIKHHLNLQRNQTSDE